VLIAVLLFGALIFAIHVLRGLTHQNSFHSSQNYLRHLRTLWFLHSTASRLTPGFGQRHFLCDGCRLLARENHFTSDHGHHNVRSSDFFVRYGEELRLSALPVARSAAGCDGLSQIEVEQPDFDS